MTILIINGPNLNLLGTREPEIYGDVTMEEYIGQLREEFPDHIINYFQSNHEGDIIDKLQEFGFTLDGIILNAGAYTHTSIAIADAIKSISTAVIEVHISDIYKREKYRHHSFLKEVCIKQINGEGISGYKKALQFLIGAKS